MNSLQADLNRLASEAAELRNNLAFHETASAKAKEELVLALTNTEKLKNFFEAERSTWEVQRAALEKRAKDAEAALKPVTQELSGLKQQIELMTSAIFGEYPSLYVFHPCNLLCRSGLTRQMYIGRRITHLGDDVRKKLKAAYTLVEQLYSGGQRAISAMSHNKPAPTTSKPPWRSCLSCLCVWLR